ncbi:MAG: hypothetical protein ACE5Q6_19975, partial [Dehalococcoidia bacterium]
MVTAQIPGINISILRQQPTTQRRVPLLISGRVTALGLPAPAVVRVALEGPSFAPEVTNFDTFAAPTGDYAVPIIADQDGQYTVTARAFPPVALPVAVPGLPSPIDILPPVAESPSPPIVVGQPVNGEVTVEGPTGRQRVAAPQPTAIEVQAPVQVSPLIPITIGAPGAAAPAFPAPAPTGLPPDIPGPIIIETVVTPPPPPAPAPEPEGVVSAQVV